MDQLKTFLEIVKRHHFWFIAPLILLLGLTGWYISAGRLQEEFERYRSQVQSNFSSAQAVTAPHPNTRWHEGMKQLISLRTENVKQAWQTKYDRQSALLTWPEELPADFHRLVASLPPFEQVDPSNPRHDIPPPLRQTYGSYIKRELPKLAQRIGSKWEPSRRVTVRGFGASTEPRRTQGSLEGEIDQSLIVRWNPANQAVIEGNFDWGPGGPTTLQLLYAQEDLWILRALVDIIKATNGDAQTQAQAAIKNIVHIQIGKDVEEQEFRVLMPGPLGAAAGVASDEPPRTEGRPEVSTYQQSSEAGTTEVDPNANHPAKNRYVDRDYQRVPIETLLSPEPPAELAVAKRIPVRMRVEMDQRAIDSLLVQCANSPLTVEVRQLRFNPQDTTDTGSLRTGSREPSRGEPTRMTGPAVAKVMADYQSLVRPVEIYGIVYIFNRVDTSKLGNTGDLAAVDDEI